MRIAIAFLALSLASPALAEWNPANGWISASRAASIIAARGYRVSEVKATEHEWEGHAFRSGSRYEFRLDPRTGRILYLQRT